MSRHLHRGQIKKKQIIRRSRTNNQQPRISRPGQKVSVVRENEMSSFIDTVEEDESLIQGLPKNVADLIVDWIIILDPVYFKLVVRFVCSDWDDIYMNRDFGSIFVSSPGFRMFDKKVLFNYCFGYLAMNRKNIPVFCARHGHLACLKYAREVYKCPWDYRVTLVAAKNGHLDCLMYAHKNGCTWGVLTTRYAAMNGFLDCLKYLHENGCGWDITTTTYAAEHGRIDCLRYAMENGCKCDFRATTAAAKNGQLACLKLLHQYGCPWNGATCRYAAMNGHLECLIYAHENDCEWNGSTIAYAAANGHIDCLEYALQNGCTVGDTP
eukprot:TRINITY_DN1594_c0_g1_i1.p1 TRINITY_DN1594_c0_g1~~TRINITY_DN1594_c0_g1_i1.p1  ORF type:complete len:332 (-),score=55.16 TRINITY_DN1594_c0_g1_i1:48-1019(-)